MAKYEVIIRWYDTSGNPKSNTHREVIDTIRNLAFDGAQTEEDVRITYSAISPQDPAHNLVLRIEKVSLLEDKSGRKDNL